MSPFNLATRGADAVARKRLRLNLNESDRGGALQVENQKHLPLRGLIILEYHTQGRCLDLSFPLLLLGIPMGDHVWDTLVYPQGIPGKSDGGSPRARGVPLGDPLWDPSGGSPGGSPGRAPGDPFGDPWWDTLHSP